MVSKKEFLSQRLSQQSGYLFYTGNQQAFQLTPVETDSTSFEVRLVSRTDGSEFLSWIAGLWYGDSEVTIEDLAFHQGDDASFFGLFDVSDGFVYGDSLSIDFNKELALYGEVSMHFTEQATLTLGYRRSDVEVDNEVLRADGPIAAGGSLIGVDQKVQEDINTYKVNFEYALNEDVLLYALASSGYRAGGFNAANPFAGTPPTTYGSDTLWNYELGARTSWLDDRLTANGVIYRIDWSDMQLTKQLVGPTGAATITANVGKAKVEGLELETRYRINESLSLGLNYAYTDTTLEEDIPGENAFKGDRLPGSADHIHSIFIDYIRPVTDEMDLDIRLTQRYIGTRVTTLGGGDTGQKLSEVPSYDTTDLKVGITHNNGLHASLFANNMFNNIGVTWIELAGFYERKRITTPRVVGFNVGYDF